MKTTTFNLILAALLITGCSQSAQAQTKSVSTNPSGNAGTSSKISTLYDEVVHYQIDISTEKISEIERKKNKTASEKKLIALIDNPAPGRLSDSALVSNLEAIGYKKHSVDPKYFQKLDATFSKEDARDVAYACIEEYRDVLIFKKNKKIVEIAKVCFHCAQSFMIGKVYPQSRLKSESGYSDLHSLLNKNMGVK